MSTELKVVDDLGGGHVSILSASAHVLLPTYSTVDCHMGLSNPIYVRKPKKIFCKTPPSNLLKAD